MFTRGHCGQTRHSKRCAQIEILTAGERRTLRVRCVNRRPSARLTRVYTFTLHLSTRSARSARAHFLSARAAALECECDCRCLVHTRLICISLCDTEPTQIYQKRSFWSESAINDQLPETNPCCYLCACRRVRVDGGLQRERRVRRGDGRVRVRRGLRGRHLRALSAQAAAPAYALRSTLYAYLHAHIHRHPTTVVLVISQ